MIRTYSVVELEDLSGITRRSIGDYVAKGLLSGPSHRGRGACYPQADLDALLVLPKLRTLLKAEFPSIKSIGVFLLSLSPPELRGLAKRSNERAFVLEVRRLRVRSTIISMFPAVPPEVVDEALAELTPEQVRGIDSGRYQIGSVLDIASLSDAGAGDSRSTGGNATHRNGPAEMTDRHLYAVDGMRGGDSEDGADSVSRNTAPPQLRAVPKHQAAAHGNEAYQESGIGERMQEMTQRLERIEKLLAVDS